MHVVGGENQLLSAVCDLFLLFFVSPEMRKNPILASAGHEEAERVRRYAASIRAVQTDTELLVKMLEEYDKDRSLGDEVADRLYEFIEERSSQLPQVNRASFARCVLIGGFPIQGALTRDADGLRDRLLRIRREFGSTIETWNNSARSTVLATVARHLRNLLALSGPELAGLCSETLVVIDQLKGAGVGDIMEKLSDFERSE